MTAQADRERTPEEDAAFDAYMEQVSVARELIIEDAGRDKSAQGAISCPVEGCNGVLMYSIASNGHVHARCSTAGCLQWME